MSEQQLRKDIEQLKALLQEGQLDAELNQQAEALVADMEAQLQEGLLDTMQHMPERLRDAVTAFEVSHPRMTAVLNNILQTLHNMGI